MNLEVGLIIDLGKTHNKFYIFDNKTENIKKLFIYKNRIKKINKEYVIDLDKITQQLRSTILFALKKYKIKYINCCTHGSVTIGLNNEGQVVSKLSDENRYKKNVNKNFFDLVSNSNDTYTPILSNGYNLLKTIFYLKNFKPKIFDKIKYFLNYPQYISFYLSNKIASEFSYLGNHSFLWNFKTNSFSNLYKKFKLKKFFKNYKNSHSVNGFLKKSFFEKNNYYKIPILTGGHDSMSCLFYHHNLFQKKFILLSSGTWFVFFHPFTKIINSNYYYSITSDKKKITTFRFPGGIIYQKFIKKNYDYEYNLSFLIKILDQKNFILDKKKLTKKFSKKYQYYLLVSYLAIKTYHMLKQIGKLKYPIIVDGIISRNKLFLKILSSITQEQNIYRSNDFHGVARGMLVKRFRGKYRNYTIIKKNKKLSKKLIHYYKFFEKKFN